MATNHHGDQGPAHPNPVVETPKTRPPPTSKRLTKSRMLRMPLPDVRHYALMCHVHVRSNQSKEELVEEMYRNRTVIIRSLQRERSFRVPVTEGNLMRTRDIPSSDGPAITLQVKDRALRLNKDRIIQQARDAELGKETKASQDGTQHEEIPELAVTDAMQVDDAVPPTRALLPGALAFPLPATFRSSSPPVEASRELEAVPLSESSFSPLPEVVVTSQVTDPHDVAPSATSATNPTSTTPKVQSHMKEPLTHREHPAKLIPMPRIPDLKPIRDDKGKSKAKSSLSGIVSSPLIPSNKSNVDKRAVAIAYLRATLGVARSNASATSTPPAVTTSTCLTTAMLYTKGKKPLRCSPPSAAFSHNPQSTGPFTVIKNDVLLEMSPPPQVPMDTTEEAQAEVGPRGPAFHSSPRPSRAGGCRASPNALWLEATIRQVSTSMTVDAVKGEGSVGAKLQNVWARPRAPVRWKRMTSPDPAPAVEENTPPLAYPEDVL
ncbi:hypothetical protein EUX98_g3144 [Antrodiella citrinella]|uniref:Uncharacterized protein n=1 Tax=Antrodiella citrinella TaxID=2447956 RepID=A0A4S4MZS3_9APHY|nr:hypothetical protein EUX98_g3144 [Antrodiella citrinella]